MDELTQQFVSQIGTPLIRVISAMEAIELRTENIANGSPCGCEKVASEESLNLSTADCITIPGVADYIIRSLGIAGVHIYTAGRLLLLDHKYFPRSSVMALARISMEASANALWLCSNNIPWDERLHRFASLYLDRMTARKADYTNLAATADSGVDDVITAAKAELTRHGWQCVPLPGYAQRVEDAWLNLGDSVDGLHVYGLTSKAIHADPTLESFDVSNEGQLRDRVISAVYVTSAVVLWLQAHSLSASWQGVPISTDVIANVKAFYGAVGDWLDVAEGAERQ